jgi:hypothetical protein
MPVFTQERILITLRNAGACLPDNQTDAVDVGTPELTSPRLQHVLTGSQVALVRSSPVAFGS